MPKIFEELDRQVDKWEPTAAAISLGSLGLGAGISTTAVGAPIGGIIAGVGQLPSLVIDGYQAGRGWYKTFKESPSNFGNAVWNTLETGADILGAKFATALTKEVLIFLDLAYTNLVITLNIILQELMLCERDKSTQY